MNRSSSRRNRSSNPPARTPHSPREGVLGAVFEAARERAGEQVGELVEQVKHGSQEFLSERKSLLAEQFTNVGGAIRRAADKLHDTDSAMLAGYVDRAADKVEDVGRYIERHDLRDVVEDAGELARRQPMLFVGGMFLAGLAAARLIKAATAQEAGRSRPRRR